ncbi:putative membrane protein 83 [Achromobacter xylosoxidans A8]|uniref:Putative membrane protein 83 n=1 Tax=Achromobacter xylosoxidans (strain A8) TaxID=762376 RepID=E3HIA9_ACHXA|nr:hypothetical protein [Achromobacter xylosoxidans]ADP19102.1 putative membrane protein 83 [Achromobacter xylosoxidans A8]
MLLGGAASITFSWYCFHGLAWLARSVGIVPIAHFDPPVSQWILIGDPILQGWHKVSVSEDFTLAGIALIFLTLVLSYYVARVAYHLSFAKVFTRYDRWFLAGWIVGAPLMAAVGHLLVVLVFEHSWAQEWPTLSGVAVLIAFSVSAKLFVDSWQWIMRRRRVHPI